MKRLWLVILLLLILAVPTTAQTADPTPSPAPQGNQAPTGSPILGILVLVAPFLFLIWKSRGKKDAPRVTSGACMPVMGQERSPEPPPDENT